jgi:hypothetical protein
VTEPRPTAAVGARAALGPATVVVVLLWALGGVLGLIWQWWSPAGPAGYVIRPGVVQPDETESFVAGDGRYAVLTVAVGIAAGLLVWFLAVARGTLAALALAAGCLGGAVLTEFVGHWTGGGTADGRANTVLAHLPLSLHMGGLRYAEAAAAMLVYGLCVAFTVHDDLGRPDPLRDAVRSVRADVQLQDVGSDGDRPGGPQQGDLTPQQHGGPA